MKRRSAFALLAVLLGALGLSAAALVGQSRGPESTAQVTREDFEVVVEAPGKLEAAVAFEIGPPSIPDVWRYDLSWLIPEGEVVKSGDVVARFDSTELDERLRDHRAALEKVLQEKEKEKRNLEVELRELRLDLVKAEGELKTLELDLSVPAQLRSSIEVSQLLLRRTLARQRVDFLSEKIEFKQEWVKTKLELLDIQRAYEESKVAYHEGAVEKFAVKAPVAGLVVYIPKRDGGRWEVGEGVWMLAKLMEIADISTLQVKASILEVDASRIAPGQSAEITVDAVPGLRLASSIVEIGRIVHERSLQDRSKVFDAILPLDGGEGEQVRPGMGVRVKVRTDLLPGRLTVPLEAVRASADGASVEIMESGGPKQRAVTLGQRNAERVVVDSGVREGEVVRLIEERG